MSFALYLTHWPLLLVLRPLLLGSAMGAGVRAACALIAPLVFAAALAPLLEGVVPRLLRETQPGFTSPSAAGVLARLG